MSLICNPSYEYFNCIESTHIAAREFSSGCVVVFADQQTAGIGKRLRKWFSPLGNVYFSVALPFEISANNLSFMSLLVGCAVRDFLAQQVGEIGLNLHWPNDVFLRDKKVCGILLEVPQKSRLIISVGINTNITPNEIADRAVSLGLNSINSEIIFGIIDFINKWYEIFIRDKIKVIDYWNDHLLGKGQKATISIGNDKVSGTLIGLDEDGCLIIYMFDGAIRKISSGEVFI